MLRQLNGFPVESWPAMTITQHALAGKAAVGLAQMTEQASHSLQPPPMILEYVKNMNQFAQKADLTRKILERYLIGTELNRVEPVEVPFSPEAARTYPVPAGDNSVMNGFHAPMDPNAPPMGPPLRPGQYPPRYPGQYPVGGRLPGSTVRAGIDDVFLIPLPMRSKRELIRSFI